MLTMIFNVSWQNQIRKIFPQPLWFRSCHIEMKNSNCQISTGGTEKNCKATIFCDLWVYTFVFSVQYAIYIVRVVVLFLSKQFKVGGEYSKIKH